MKVVRLSITLILVLFLIEVGLMALFNNNLPTRLGSPLWDFFPTFRILWPQNPWKSLWILVDHPVVAVEHMDPQNGLTSWGIYYYPNAVVAHAVAAMIAAMLRSDDARQVFKIDVAILAAGATSLILSVSYLSVAAHCSGPTWAVDVGFRALSNPVNETAMSWYRVYLSVYKAFSVMQIALTLIGAGLLFQSTRLLWRKSRRQNNEYS